MKKTLSTLLAASALLLAAPAVQAHQIWFEQAPDRSMTFYYGEYDSNMLEVTPGGMDRFKALEAQWTSASGTVPLKMKLERDHFTVAQKPGKNDSWLAFDKQYPIFQVKDEGKTVSAYWTPATRWVSDFRAREPELDLDIVPTGVVKGDEVEFQVFHLHDPLGNVPVKLSSGSGWVLLATTDGEGKVRFTLPWKGTYVLGIEYRDRSEGGERVGIDGNKEKYDILAYSSSLSFHKATGLAPLPRAESTLPASEIARLNKK
ncbi:DUF4198 domain-containing protein [Pseudomonas capsici]|uniref:DUF4198 domain-containing protein n=1 Tax=Pseudomonas capsici TaxID=2810614 RepID=UPI000E3DBCF9|nr:DUF4198 domain-containing protein [Pseudomonas capsici]MBN6712535.1 DUF4198 domain-containing protein [Pseudomonas capsici]MBN6717728.1 DUF4198 domain-containing protein [Pseudomonas capsici]MBN6723221.1 DUF4198 domain-containing protein [Pseudomonas capsici]